MADLKAHPTIAPLLRGSTLREYAAHLIPEGGYDTMPRLATDGLLVAGDAGAMTLAAGLWLEGVNFAIGSGHAAGRAADRALAAGDCSARGSPRTGPTSSRQFVLADHKRLRKAPSLVLSDRVQRALPGPPVRPGRGNVHRDQPHTQGGRPEASPARRRPATGSACASWPPTPCGA